MHKITDHKLYRGYAARFGDPGLDPADYPDPAGAHVALREIIFASRAGRPLSAEQTAVVRAAADLAKARAAFKEARKKRADVGPARRDHKAAAKATRKTLAAAADATPGRRRDLPFPDQLPSK